jgi:hypothetical protein
VFSTIIDVYSEIFYKFCSCVNFYQQSSALSSLILEQKTLSKPFSNIFRPKPCETRTKLCDIKEEKCVATSTEDHNGNARDMDNEWERVDKANI